MNRPTPTTSQRPPDQDPGVEQPEPVPAAASFAGRGFVSHRWIRGGDLQTLIAPLENPPAIPRAQRIDVEVSDGDQIALHRNDPTTKAIAENQNADESPSAHPQERNSHHGSHSHRGSGVRASVILVHGISGCHAAPYMIRMAKRFLEEGFQTYRTDMRGCGSVSELSDNVSHAGRSDDVAAAIEVVHRHDPSLPIFVVGVSLGGNQTLRLMGRIGDQRDAEPDGYDQIAGVAAIAPPVDLHRCSDNMQRIRNRIYNRYFIRSLLRRLPDRIARRPEFQTAIKGPVMRTLLDLDDRLTAPLSGFPGADEYYRYASSVGTLEKIQKPTLILAADDDPIVPASIFSTSGIEGARTAPTDLARCRRRLTVGSNVEVMVTRGGGHAGYIGPRGSRRWLDDGLVAWFNSQLAADHPKS